MKFNILEEHTAIIYIVLAALRSLLSAVSRYSAESNA